jgi:hypothetical protein
LGRVANLAGEAILRAPAIRCNTTDWNTDAWGNFLNVMGDHGLHLFSFASGAAIEAATGLPSVSDAVWNVLRAGAGGQNLLIRGAAVSFIIEGTFGTVVLASGVMAGSYLRSFNDFCRLVTVGGQ